ncbi:MAG TPA: rhomboid family intramembrane serine protease [Acidimicrobiales bacterium]|nr:rhomboid family intramembrane serine protease [Acidimicrobiales bacterium]
MIPLKDENPTATAPVLTVVLIIACVAVWILVQGAGRRTDSDAFTVRTAAIPCEVVKARPLSKEEVFDTFGPPQDKTACEAHPTTPAEFPGKRVYLALLFTMFMHGSWLHLAGNMLFLWIFGNNVEDRMGKVGYLAFYLAAGMVATGAHILGQPSSTVPIVGASGAIAGVMGAYFVLWPNVRIRSLIFLGYIVLFRDIAAKWLLGIWLVTQFFINPNEGVAWVAHVGGFAFGVLVGLVLRASGEPERRAGPAPTPWRYS